VDKKFEFNSKLLKNMDGYRDVYIKEVIIYSVSTLKKPKDNTLIFTNNLNKEIINRLEQIKNSIIVISNRNSYFNSDLNCVLNVNRPRKEYARILQFILSMQLKDNRKYVLKDGYYIGENARIGENTIIEPLSFIDHEVTIGDNCKIKSGAKIRSNVIIGDNCIIKENCVIGDDGFGVERDPDGTTYKIPHLGGVVIKNNVEIGAMSCICQGTIEPTVIEEYVKIDDCCFVAHNCNIGRGTFIIANSEISGSVSIGKNSWIAPNACIRDGIKIGDNVTVGMGAVVVKNVDNNELIIGNPGRKFNTSKNAD
jgi:UDP-3-O-[3-hydroxymyristoyl] glucosamine N-acyltransferase